MGPLPTNTPFPAWDLQPGFNLNGGLGALSSINVYLDCKESRGLSHQLCQRWGDVSSLWEVAFKGHRLRFREKKSHGWGYFPLHMLLKKGISRHGPGFCPSCLIDCLLSSWNQLCLHVASLAGYRSRVPQNSLSSSALCGRGDCRSGRSCCFSQEPRGQMKMGSPKQSWVSFKVCKSVL